MTKTRLEIPEEFEWYDPFDQSHWEGILKHFDVRLDHSDEKPLGHSWGYVWKYGGGVLAPYQSLTEDQAKAVMGLSVYLYACGVRPGLDDRLAFAYIKQGWDRSLEHQKRT